jgi:hypothetical protein
MWGRRTRGVAQLAAVAAEMEEQAVTKLQVSHQPLDRAENVGPVKNEGKGSVSAVAWGR